MRVMYMITLSMVIRSDILIYGGLFYLARLMVPRKQGLIVNISSVGGMRYLFNVAYGVGKVKFLVESF